MTSEEHLKLINIGNSFWEKLGELAADHIVQMPNGLEDITVAHLQNMCSIYSTNYSSLLISKRQR